MSDKMKREVSYPFVFRAGAMIPAVVQAVTYKRFLNGGRTSIDLVPTLALQEIWLVYSLLSSTIPALRAFVGAFTTQGLIITNHSTIKQSSQGRSIALSSMNGGKHRQGAGHDVLAHSLARSNSRPDVAYGVHVGYTNKLRAAIDRSEQGSIRSDGSEQRIIRVDTQIELRHEQRSY
ncbi:hypothetical protein LTR22_026810 [Elasticomyces elasticus]|nr:hypothetical protein LTR22_026810 [Elasticomyces elasticus]